MAALTHNSHAHIRTTPKGVCGIVQICTAHKMRFVEFVQIEILENRVPHFRETKTVEQTGIAPTRKPEFDNRTALERRPPCNRVLPATLPPSSFLRERRVLGNEGHSIR